MSTPTIARAITTDIHFAVTDQPGAPPVPRPTSPRSLLPPVSDKLLVKTVPLTTLWMWGGEGNDGGPPQWVPVHPNPYMNPPYPIPYLSEFTYWSLVQSTIANGPSTYTNTYTYISGWNQTQEYNLSCELNAGIEVGPVSLGASMSSSFGSSFETYDETQLSHQFQVPVEAGNTDVISVWQLYRELVFTDVNGVPISYAGAFNLPDWQSRPTSLSPALNSTTVKGNVLYFDVVPFPSAITADAVDGASATRTVALT